MMADPSSAACKLVVRLATVDDRDAIARLRHEVYAQELAQHSVRTERRLSDGLDSFNTYLVADCGGAVAGFISITPPGHGTYSVDKYLSCSELSPLFDDRTFEVRLLTISKPFRRRTIAPLLMYAALRWVQDKGGSRIIGIGRREVLTLYRKV